MRSVGHDYKEQVLLCTGNEKLSKLGQTLERLGIPVLFLGSLFERPEIKELLSMVSILTDRRATGLVRVASGADFGMPIGDVCAVLDYFSINELEAGHWIRSAHEVPAISEEAKSALKKLAATLNGFKAADQPWEVLAKLLFDRTATASGIATSQSIQTRAQGIAIWQFMNFVRVQPVKKGLPIVRLLERVRRLLRLGDDRDLRQLPAAAQGVNAVRLMTIHGSKGLEFEVVHLPGFNTGAIPRAVKTPPCPPPDGMVEAGDGKAVELFKLGEAEEQECLFYVSMSRAKDRFFAYAPTKQAGGKSRGLSPFLPRLGSRISQRRVKPATPLPADPEDAAISLSIDGALSFRGEQVALFDNCPRRFF
jgi:superfamily I DNA/RNA helicase